MSALNNQTKAIDEQEAALLAQLAQLQAKKQAVIDLESEYTATIEHVKRTMDMMTAAGLDSRNLLKDLATLITPSTVSTRATRTKSDNDNSKLNRPSPDTKGGKSWAICDRLLLQYGDIEKVKGSEVGRLALEEHDDKYGSWHCNNWKQAQKSLPAPVVAPIESEPTPAPVEPVATPKPTMPPVFEVSPAPEVSKTEAKYIDKKIEAASKVQSKKR